MKNNVKFLMTTLLALSLFSPLANVIFAQPGSDLIANLRNRTKLQDQANKFESQLANLKSLTAKSIFTNEDLHIIDRFIDRTDGEGVPIVVRAHSKAFVAAQKVQAFEDGVKNAAQGKNPADFIKSLEDNPAEVMEIPGAAAAGQAFSKSLDADAYVLKTLSAKLKGDANRLPPYSLFNENVQFTTAKFSLFDSERKADSLINEFDDAEPKSMARPGVVEIALIALAAAYLSVKTFRLSSGAIGTCVNREIETYRQCSHEAKFEPSLVLIRKQQVMCKVEYLADVAVCIWLPF